METPDEILVESSYCYTLRGSPLGNLHLLVVGMDSGTVLDLGRLVPDTPVDGTFQTTGLALSGDQLVFSGKAEVGFRFFVADLDTRQVVSGSETDPLVSVAAMEDRLAIFDTGVPGGILFFDTFDDLSAGVPSGELRGDFGGPLLAFEEGLAYTSAQAAGEVEVIEAQDGERVRVVSLDGWDGWTAGVSGGGGYLHLIGDRPLGVTVSRFSRHTGQQAGSALVWSEPGSSPSGLLCGP